MNDGYLYSSILTNTQRDRVGVSDIRHGEGGDLRAGG